LKETTLASSLDLIASLNLRDRVALVTGGSRGIGRAAVNAFASLGANVVINYVRDEQAASEAVDAAERAGVSALAVRADVSHLDNAGIWEGGAVEALSEDAWDRTMNLNLKGTWAACRAAVPAMKAQRFGRIVIVSSTAGQRGEANVSNYAASKGGQIAFTKSLAAELGPLGINVNSVAPGWVDTDMCAEVFADPNFRKSIEDTIPVGRVATPADIGWPIVFLCSEWSRHINGEVLNVNGGSVLCG